MERKAALRGLSTGEFLRRKANEDEEISEEEEAQLAALVEEVNVAIPKMRQSLEKMSRTLRETHEEVDRSLRAAGIRK